MVYYLLSNKPVWRSNKNLLDATEKNAEMKPNCSADKTGLFELWSPPTPQLKEHPAIKPAQEKRSGLCRGQSAEAATSAAIISTRLLTAPIETSLLICISTHLPDTQKHVEQPQIHVFVFILYPSFILSSGAKHAALSTPKMEIAEFGQVAYKSYR